MKYQKLGQSNIEASVVGLGTWAIGGWMWGGTDEDAAVKAIQAAIDAGVNLIDTAPAYGMGLSEEIVGRAITGQRDKVIIATKCGLVWHTDKGEKIAEQNGKEIHRYLGPDSIRYEVEQSLKRLQTDYIDLYQTHWQDKTTSIKETMAALLDLKREGKIRAIGVSNIESQEQLERYQHVGPVDTAQEKYNMIDRQLEEWMLPYCQEHNIGMLSYSSLGSGLLTGKMGPDREFSGDDLRLDNPRYSVESRQIIADMLAKFEPIAQKHDVSMAQLVIAWTIAQPGITHVLCGARRPDQALENAGAGDVVLSEDDIQQMNQAIEKYTPQIPHSPF